MKANSSNQQKISTIFLSGKLFPQTGTSARIVGLSNAYSKTLNNSKILQIEPVNHSHNKKSKLHYFHMILQFTRFWRNFKLLYQAKKILNFDVIHTRVFNLPISLPLKLIYNIRLVGDYHALSSLETENPVAQMFWRIVERIGCLFFDAVIVPTPELKKYLQKKCKKRSIYVIPNPVEYNKSSTFRLKKSSREIILFYHGTNYEENIKGLYRFIRITETLNKKGYKTRGLVAGNLPKLKESKNIEYLGYLDNLDSHILKAHIGVLPVKPKSLGIRSRALEYLRNGVPVVTTPHGATGLASAVKLGIVRLGNNENDMIKVIIEIMNHLQQINVLIKPFLENNFSYEIIGDKLYSIYKTDDL